MILLEIKLSLIAFYHKNNVTKRSFFDIYKRKESFLDQNSEVLTRAKKWTFSKGVSPWILSKNRNFSYGFFFTEIMAEKIVFRYFGEKRSFLDPKIEVSTRAKKLTFF